MPGLIGLASLSADITATIPLTTPAVSTATTGTLTVGTLNRLDATSAPLARTLPSAATAGAGGIVVVKKTDATSNAVSVTASGSDTINVSGSTRTLTLPREAAHFRSDGVSDWTVVASDTPVAQLDSRYDARYVTPATGNGTYARLAGTRVGFIGNSITIGAFGTPSDVYTGNVQHGSSPATFALAASDGRWELVTNAGVAGNTSAQILARIQADIIDTGCDVCVLGEIFRNDVATGVSLATTKANLAAMVAQLRAAGIQPVLVTPTPDDPVSPSTSVKALLNQVFRWVQNYARVEHLPLVDWYSPLIDGATGNLAASYIGNAVHPNTAGNYILGLAAQAVLDQVCRPSAWPSVTNAVDSTDLLGGLGLFVGTPSGGVAGGWASTIQTGCVASIVTDSAVRGSMQRLACTATASDSFVNKTGITTGWSVGDTVEISGYVTHSGGTSQSRVELKAYNISSVRSLMTVQAITRGAGSGPGWSSPRAPLSCASTCTAGPARGRSTTARSGCGT